VNPLLQPLTVPDLWQQEAVKSLRAGRDVVVHAPTGAGKTYIFELLYPQLKGQAVFTVPTRALANDKLAEWRERGWDVGISTGDLALRPDARVIVATLETQRGRFLRREGPQLLVVDEYQLIADAHRGVNYELAIALAPPETQLLLLSGSVANPRDIVAWLRRIGRDAVLVSHDTRPVPLTEVDLEAIPNRAPANLRGYWPRLVHNALRADLGPVLMFAPRRNASEEIAQSLVSAVRDLPPLALSAEQEALAGPRLAKLLRSRVAFHHSGLSYAQRAGVVEPLAKNGQLRVVVATLGLAAGINFSMRSIVVTDTRYMAGNFERQVQPDELLQMFGRAGRRGLDDAGHVLFTSKPPRLADGQPRQLKRATKLDWPTLIAVMHGATARGTEPFGAALELNRRLFSPQEVPLGVERARATGPMPCGFSVDMERARLIRRQFVEMRNSCGEWEPISAVEEVPLSDAWAFDGQRWRRALSIARTLDGLGYGQLCRLPIPNERRYGREVVLGTRREGGLDLAPWLRRQLIVRHISDFGLQREVLSKLPDLASLATARNGRSPEPSALVVAGVFPRGEQLVAHFDFSLHCVKAHRDSHGRALIAPETRDIRSPCCEGCPEAGWCRSVEIVPAAAWSWRHLGLIEPDGRPTRRGIIFSFFHHGEGLAIAAALEDPAYAIADLLFDLANLRAGPRFSGDDSPWGGRLGALCQKLYGHADLPGYLSMGVPVEYGAGAAGVAREIVVHRTPVQKLLTEMLRPGDIERALIEWRSVLRHIALAPDYDWERWREFKRAAARTTEIQHSSGLPELPPLTAAQRKRP
jgi:superfamily II DNA/RNA helicase